MTKSELDRRLDNVLEKYTKHVEAKFDQVDVKFDLLKSELNARFEHIDHKFALIDKKLEHIDRKFELVDHRLDQVDNKYKWLLGVLISATISIIGVVIKLH